MTIYVALSMILSYIVNYYIEAYLILSNVLYYNERCYTISKYIISN